MTVRLRYVHAAPRDLGPAAERFFLGALDREYIFQTFQGFSLLVSMGWTTEEESAIERGTTVRARKKGES